MSRRTARVLALSDVLMFRPIYALAESAELVVTLLGYLIGQLGALLPLPGGIGGIGGGLVGTPLVYGAPAA